MLEKGHPERRGQLAIEESLGDAGENGKSSRRCGGTTGAEAHKLSERVCLREYRGKYVCHTRDCVGISSDFELKHSPAVAMRCAQ